jgi:hypothetical protein
MRGFVGSSPSHATFSETVRNQPGWDPVRLVRKHEQVGRSQGEVAPRRRHRRTSRPQAGELPSLGISGDAGAVSSDRRLWGRRSPSPTGTQPGSGCPGGKLAHVDGIVGGVRHCLGLSDLGRRQVEALRDRLKCGAELGEVDILYASMLPPAA